MKPTTAEELAHRAQELQLVSAAFLDDIWSELGGHNVPIEELGTALVRRELLTGFQLERLLKGERAGFFFGKAKLLYQVGAGSFARVYRALDVNDGGILAVKVLRSRFSADAEKCRAFRREGEMGRLLRHPNIVAIEDVGQEGATSYITMEFIEGQTLRELVRIRGAVDLPRALDLLQQLISGLDYAHRRGVTHRDLKASNVLVSSTGQAKLVDFGLAGVEAETGDRHLDRTEQPRTVDYAALEKLSGMKDDSLRSDIFFLGTIAYLMLSGKPALVESRDRLVRSDPRRFTGIESLSSRVPGLPRDVLDFIARMMHVDPLERWQSASQMLRVLEPLALKYGEGQITNVGGGTGVMTSSPTTLGARAATKGTLMVVETSEKAQESLRSFFTKLGYRVLMTENPQRALARFSTTPLPADCLVMSTQSLDQAAVDAFNQLSSDPFFAAVPAILLTSPKQKSLSAQAKLDDRRRMLQTPIRTAEMSQLLEELVKK